MRTGVQLAPFSLMMFPTIYIYTVIVRETSDKNRRVFRKGFSNLLSAK